MNILEFSKIRKLTYDNQNIARPLVKVSIPSRYQDLFILTDLKLEYVSRMQGEIEIMMRLLVREDGRTERVCEHDIGHTIDAPEQLKKSWVNIGIVIVVMAVAKNGNNFGPKFIIIRIRWMSDYMVVFSGSKNYKPYKSRNCYLIG